MSELSEKAFRALLKKKGFKLDEKAFAAALDGARHMRASVAQVGAYLAMQQKEKL